MQQVVNAAIALSDQLGYLVFPRYAVGEQIAQLVFGRVNHGAMPRRYAVGVAVQQLRHRVHIRIHIAVIRAYDRGSRSKNHIAAEERSRLGMQGAQAAERMPRRVNELQRGIAQLQPVAVANHVVHACAVQLCLYRLALRRGAEQVAARRLAQPERAADVVAVAVRQDNGVHARLALRAPMRQVGVYLFILAVCGINERGAIVADYQIHIRGIHALMRALAHNNLMNARRDFADACGHIGLSLIDVDVNGGEWVNGGALRMACE